MGLLKDKMIIEGEVYAVVYDPKRSCMHCDLASRCKEQEAYPCAVYHSGNSYFVRMPTRKAYISMPISGRDHNDIHRRLQAAIHYLQSHGYSAEASIDISNPQAVSFKTTVGEDVQTLLSCDAVLMMPGWEHNNQCRLDYAAAEIFGKTIIHYNEQ